MRSTVNVIASAAVTASASSTGIQAVSNYGGPERSLALLVHVTAVSGTNPTLDLSVEWSFDNTTFCLSDPADTFTQITAAAQRVKSFTIKAPFYRLTYAIGGTATPTFTFAVDAVVTN